MEGVGADCRSTRAERGKLTATMEDEGLAPGTVLDGKFRIVRCLGSGGMGAVYEVQHELTRHRRALKLLHPGFATQREPVERFLREASVAGRIDNPHITETYDAGWLSTGAPYVVMEYLEGETVGQKIEREGALPLDFVLTMMSQTCRGLASAHEAGIVHRDLKPDNLLVDKDGKIHVLDFGIARLLDDVTQSATSTKTGTAFGTPGFMAPEQALGKTNQISARTDLYALGATLFALVCGDFVHAAENPQELLVLVATQPARSLSELAPNMHPDVVAIIDKSTRNLAEERWPSAAAMLDAVRHTRERLGVAHVRVMPLSPAADATPPPIAGPYNYASNPAVASNASPPVYPAPERSSHPDAMTFASSPPADPPSGIGPAPVAVPSHPLVEKRRSRVLPVAIATGIAAVIGLLVVVAVTRTSEQANAAATAAPVIAQPKPAEPIASASAPAPEPSVEATAAPTETVAVTPPSASIAPTATTAKVIKVWPKPTAKPTSTASSKPKGIEVGY
jgi:eukaryotic-like serine/threonine-protein kinase